MGKIKLLSLFSGIGAFEKALDRIEAEYELIGYSELINMRQDHMQQSIM